MVWRVIWSGVLIAVLLLAIIAIKILFFTSINESEKQPEKIISIIPDIKSLPNSKEADLIKYGRDLIANTAKYFGPEGTISHTTNGLNCQNCHLEAGARLHANNFLAVASTFPKYRPRSGKMESVEFRVNECLERSLNGSAIDSMSLEMKAMVAYMKWLGKNIKAGEKHEGVGAIEMPLMDRAADSLKGKVIYGARCSSCHGNSGEGVWSKDSNVYRYPPLWGDNSYAVSAGMYRLGKLSGYVRNNMPPGSSQQSPLLNNEECWDVAAYINSQPRPKRMFAYDWPDIKKKPADYPFGPYADTFSEKRHKYGPFKDMK